MNCPHCGKPVELTPSAAERAKKFGGQPSDYTKLFQYHAKCLLEIRAISASGLMKRLKDGTYVRHT